MATERNMMTSLVMMLAITQVLSFKMLSLPKEPNTIDSRESEAGGRRSVVFKEKLSEDITQVAQDESIVLECEATGKPTPTIHWLFNGNRIPQSHSHSVLDEEAYFEESPHNHGIPVLRLGTTRSRLHLDCLTPEDAGLYACVADTPMDRISSTTYLEVGARPNLNPHAAHECNSMMTGAPARIYMWETHRLEFEGADVQLFCRASGYPLPEITWYDRDNQAISRQNPNFRLLKNGDLLIKSINWLEHMGQYRCHANNGHSESEVTAFLYPTMP